MKTRILLLSVVTAAGAPGALVHSGTVDIPVPTSFTGVSIDILNGTHFNGNPAADWSDSQVNFFFGGNGVFSGPRFLPVRAGSSATDMVIPLDGGDLINNLSITGPVGNGVSQGHVGSDPSQFESGVEQFLGFRIDLTGGGDFSNGYMRVTLTDGSAPGTIHEWVYSDTPGEVVTVGVVPESTTVTLVGLGMLLLFIRSRRPAVGCRG